MKRAGFSALTAVLAVSGAAAMADNIAVRVNGEPVHFQGTQPRYMNGRVMVPLRGVLEQMGATVDWNANTQTVIAARGNTEIDLPIGSRFATVNGERMPLDVPAMTIAGSTMVPLRFVSEALGAQVAWNDATQTVAIRSDGTFRAYRRPIDDHDYDRHPESGRIDDSRYYHGKPESGPVRGSSIVLPAGTVIPVRLDDRIRSDEAMVGDKFTATIESGHDDYGLPSGTKFEGVVREAIPSRSGKPGVVDVDFTRIIFPNGTARSIRASLASMEGSRLSRDSSGRLTAKSGSNNERMKWVGIGAGAGLLLGTLGKGNQLLDTILGAGAGYLYNEYKQKGGGNVDLRAGTEVGVKMDQRFVVQPGFIE